MAFAANGTFFVSTSTSVSLSNQAVGDLILIEVENPDTSVWSTAISGGGATWSQMGTKFTGTTNARSTAVFAGRVTTTGSQTATVTFNGTPTNIRVVGQEFSSTVGSWELDAQGNFDSSGTNTWASLTPAGAGELYFGYAVDAASATLGSSSGYSYHVDSVGNGCTFNPNCTSAAQAPTWGDSNQIFGIMVLVKESNGASSSMTVTGTFPDNDWNDGVFTSVYVLTGAKSAASQTGASYGTNSSTSDSGAAIITTTTAGSWVIGGYDDGAAAISSPTMLSNTIELANYADSGAGIDFLAYRSLIPVGTPGATTYGANSSASGFVNGSIAMAEILSSTTISLDSSTPSTPYVDTGAGNTSTTSSFTPVSGSLLVAVIAADANSGHSASDIQVSDSSSLTWTRLAFGNGTNGMIIAVFVADAPTASPVAIVQSGVSGYESSLTLSSGITAGHALIIGISAYNSTDQSMTVSGLTLGGTSILSSLTLLGTATNPGSGTSNVGLVSLYLLPSISGGQAGATTIATTITNANGGVARSIYAWEVSGLGSTPTLDLHVTGDNDNSGTVSLTGTTGIASELIIGLSWTYAVTITGPSGWNNLYGNSSYDSAGTIIQTTAGSVNYNPSIASSAAWAAVVVSLGSRIVATSAFLIWA